MLHAVFYVCLEEKEYPEISVSDFPAHVDNMHADSDFAFSQEFEVRLCVLCCVLYICVRVRVCVCLCSMHNFVLSKMFCLNATLEFLMFEMIKFYPLFISCVFFRLNILLVCTMVFNL